jgi:hypothetical protein
LTPDRRAPVDRCQLLVILDAVPPLHVLLVQDGIERYSAPGSRLVRRHELLEAPRAQAGVGDPGRMTGPFPSLATRTLMLVTPLDLALRDVVLMYVVTIRLVATAPAHATALTVVVVAHVAAPAVRGEVSHS